MMIWREERPTAAAVIRTMVCGLLLMSFASSHIYCSGARGPEEKVQEKPPTTADGSSTADQTQPKPDQSIPSALKLIINEVAAKGDPNDWVEVYNAGDAAVDLNGFTITDDRNDPGKGTFPADTKIQPGEYKVFYLDDTWPGFGIGGDEEIAIFDPKGNLVDVADWADGQSPAGKTWGRFPDKTGDFKTLGTPTPGAPNQDGGGGGEDKPTADAGPAPDKNPPKDDPPKDDPPQPEGKLIINEVASAGDPDDWFELYNGTNKTIDLEDYSVSDDLKDDKKRKKFPKGTQIKAGEYKVFYMKDKDKDDWPGFKLGKDEEIGLYDKDGKLVDSVDWADGDSPDGKSYGRSPDKTGKFKTLDKPTPGKANEG